jgi:hypothetical protein
MPTRVVAAQGEAARSPRAPAAAQVREYARHRPEATALYEAVRSHWTTFVAALSADGEEPPLPRFVVAEVEAYLRCGILAQGFVVARCGDCGVARAVAWSCQRRGFCPSCIGRRMSDFAARAVTCVFPRVPIRQWVLTVPHALRARMAFDPALVTVVLRELIAAVSAWLRRRARRLGIRGRLKTGAVTAIQRFNSALDLSVHFHALVLDGVYSFPAGKKPVFHPTPSPTDEEMVAVTGDVWRRVERRLGGYETSPVDRRFAEGAPLLLALAEASAAGIVATGPRRGCRIVRVRGPAADVDGMLLGKLCAQVEGYNLQAATRLAANDRDSLERMCRYLARPPVATDRLLALEDGRLELRLKRPWRDGTVGFLFTPHELLERLVALVPRPRAHLTRYHGVLAPAFARRAEIVPNPEADPPAAAERQSAPPGAEPPARAGRFPWASLLWRVFLTDALACPSCHGRMRVVAVVTSRAGVTRYLAHAGLPTDPPRFHPPRPPPQGELPFGDGVSVDADPAWSFDADPTNGTEFEN